MMGAIGTRVDRPKDPKTQSLRQPATAAAFALARLFAKKRAAMKLRSLNLGRPGGSCLTSGGVAAERLRQGRAGRWYDAAMLALVSWYLIVPPYSKELKAPDTKKPFFEWAYAGEFDSAEQCELARQYANGRDVQKLVVQKLKSRERGAATQRLGASKCIEQDKLAL
jgi:hypothetical protein